jgi:pyruvate/2-oxoglutarate dehydrogenase complex dihydrolipoamide dehydrogenase (E3) component
VPDVEGLEDVGFLTNETIFSLTDKPDSLAVFGGGPLGCELAQAFQRLGCDVHILQRSEHLLKREDPDAAAILSDAFEREGLTVHLNSNVQKVETEGERKRMHFEVDGEQKSILVDHILVGAGREPSVEGLNLEAVDVEYDMGRGIHVDDRLRTSNSDIYAAGDVCLKYKFTHTADAAARIVIQNALFWGRKKFSTQHVPWCTYTDPEVAHVGMYEDDARQAGIPVQTYRQDLSDVDRAIADGETKGFVKIHVRRGKGLILGATIVARHAGEMISEITTAMTAGMGLGKLSNVIHPYPTQAEAIRKCADEYNRERLTPFLKGLLDRLMAWRR